MDLRVVARRARLLEPQPQAGERRAQLVRRVGDEVALAGHEALEPRRHAVERRGEAALLRAALDLGAHGQVALGHPRRGVVQAPQRAGDLARDHEPRREAEPEHEQPDRGQPERRAVRRARDGVDALGHAHDADARAALHHRHGGGEDLLVERVAAAAVLDRAAAQRLGDLRPVAVVGPEPVRARGVGQQGALEVRHHDAAAHGLGGPLDRAVEGLGLVEVARHGGRDDVGLRARLRAHLGVDAVAQADRQRHLERDDREQQDVRERQQQAPAERHRNSSGAVKRKPTPRTVCR